MGLIRSLIHLSQRRGRQHFRALPVLRCSSPRRNAYAIGLTFAQNDFCRNPDGKPGDASHMHPLIYTAGGKMGTSFPWKTLGINLEIIEPGV